MAFGELILILTLIVTHGLFAGSEIAIVALRRSRLKQLVDEGKESAKAVETLQEQPERFIATVQIGLTVVSATAAALGGAFTLCALAVPEERFDAVARLVNAYPEVAHNYRRAHRLNMWFVLATERPERIEELVAEIGATTGLEVINLPKLEEYFLELKLRA